MTHTSRVRLFAVFLVLLLLAPTAAAQEEGGERIEVPEIVLTDVAFTVTVDADSSLAAQGAPVARVGTQETPLTYDAGAWTAEVTPPASGSTSVEVRAGGTVL